MSNFNIEDYLTDEEKKDIAKQVWKEKLSAKFEKDQERIISNAVYEIVSTMCDEVVPNFNSLLVEKVKGVITTLTAHTVFNKPDAWGRDGNSSYHLLKSIVASKRERINNKVDNIIDNLNPPLTDIDIDYEIRQMLLKRLGWKGEQDE